MKQAFALTVVLIGVLVAIFVLKRQSEQAPRPQAVPTAPRASAVEGGGSPEEILDGGLARGPRVVALTRLVPRYALALPTGEPETLRGDLLRRLQARGGRIVGQLPAEARASFRAEVPPGAFKPFLRDLGIGKNDLRLRGLPSRPSTDARAPVELEISFPGP
jgi:hypothetical protein